MVGRFFEVGVYPRQTNRLEKFAHDAGDTKRRRLDRGHVSPLTGFDESIVPQVFAGSVGAGFVRAAWMFRQRSNVK